MTIPVFVPGMHIDDDGNVVIDADEAAEAGVQSIELVEGKPDAEEEDGAGQCRTCGGSGWIVLSEYPTAAGEHTHARCIECG